MSKNLPAKVGRPSIFNETVKEQIYRMYEIGLTDKQVADILGVTQRTLDNWKKDKDFLLSLKDVKSVADEMVKASLFKRATGYSHKEEKIFCNADGLVTKVETVKHYAPDVTAQIFWLKNRQPEEWREKQEVEMNVQAIKITKDEEKL